MSGLPFHSVFDYFLFLGGEREKGFHVRYLCMDDGLMYTFYVSLSVTCFIPFRICRTTTLSKSGVPMTHRYRPTPGTTGGFMGGSLQDTDNDDSDDIRLMTSSEESEGGEW